MSEAHLSSGNVSGTISVEATQIIGEGGPQYPRLVIPIKVRLNASPGKREGSNAVLVLNTRIDLWVANHPTKIADGMSMVEPCRHECGNDQTMSLEIALDSYRVHWIESIRRGDLKLRLGMNFCLGLYEMVLTQKDKQTLARESIATFVRSYSQLEIDIPQSHWVHKVLPGLGNLSYFIIEIPKGRKIIEEAWRHLEQAEAAFNNWNTKGAYAHCREVAKLLDHTIKKKDVVNGFSYSEKWQRALKHFSHWASLDLHLEEIRQSSQYKPEEVLVTKSDAENLLMMTRVLIKYAEEMLSAAK